jgi:hypothetical protein
MACGRDSVLPFDLQIEESEMASEIRSWTRQGEAGAPRGVEAQRLKSTAVLRGGRHTAQGLWQLAGEVQSRATAA